ncbi:hypothetical protein THRCLA_06565 [Thraustotheca clavata]|uniref:Uncharacterized protein n=1 Tax=Thraustotheca clavata TaxID=74557 RepID=A0A1V9ZNF0_9STRA|nr:hypothetical protein THRCLA_06565 [Thraustotheca clavata]
MPLVTLCGVPGAGKTFLATKLQEHLSALGKDVVVLSYDTEHLLRNQAYQDSRAEKMTRSTMKSRVDVHLNAKKIVILDALNYIKGYRYELFCLAKELSTTHCVVFVDTPVDVAIERNESRNGDRFPTEMVEAITMRFETPNAKNRWDAPLIHLTPADLTQDKIASQLQVLEQVILQGKVIKAGIATQSKPVVETTFVQQLDQITTEIVDALVAHQREFNDLGRAMPTAELRRHRRQFIKISQLHPFPTSTIATRFVDYLNEQA